MSITMTSLEFLVNGGDGGGCQGGMALGVLSEYLDFTDFLNLSMANRAIRRSMVSQPYLWTGLYNRRTTPSALLRTSPLVTFDSDNGYRYRLNMENHVASPFESLVKHAQRSGVLRRDHLSHSNPYFNLAVTSGSYSRRMDVDVDVLKKIPVSSPRVVLSENADIAGPLTVVSKTRLFGFNRRRELVSTKIVTNVPDETRLSVIGSRWVRVVDCPYCYTERMVCRDSPVGQVSNTAEGHCMADDVSYLSLLYSNGRGEVAVSLYEYNGNDFTTKARSTWKVSVPPPDITCFDVFASSHCSHFCIFVGTAGGCVYMRCHDREDTFKASDGPVKTVLATPVGTEWLLHLLSGNDVGCLLRIGKACVMLKYFPQVSSFDLDTWRGIVGYCSNKKCTAAFNTFGDNKDFELGVPKPPTSIMFLKRRSLWVLVIRNYLKLVQVLNIADSATIHNFKTLNGHTSTIIDCRQDGWSRLVSVDTGRNVIIWDFIKGIKILGFPLLSIDPAPKVPTSRDHERPTSGRKKQSVNRQINYSSIHNIKKNFNTAAPILAPTDTEDDDDDVIESVKQLSLGRSNRVVRLNSQGVTAANSQQTISLSLLELCIYHHTLSCLQLVSFK